MAIIGCGRLGRHLAARLSERGGNVIVIDTDQRALEALPPSFSGFSHQGDASQPAVLRDCDVGRARVAFVTTRDDNLNMMIAQVIHLMLEVPRVVARVFDPEREAIYHDLGIETISPTSLAAAECFTLLSGVAARPERGSQPR